MGGFVEPNSADRIREMAAGFFAERGFAATSVRDIAGAAGLTPGAIYNHFESKEALLNDIALENHQQLLEALSRATADAGGTATERLDTLVTAVVHYVLSNPVVTRAAQREYFHLEGAHRSGVEEIRSRILEIFQSTVLEGVRSGELSLPPSGPRTPRRVVTSVVNMLVALADSHPEDGLTADEKLAIHRELVRRMLRPG